MTRILAQPRRGWARIPNLRGGGAERTDCAPRRTISAQKPQSKQHGTSGSRKDNFAGTAGVLRLLCEVGDEAIEAENVEHAGEVVAKGHQAPFATDIVEAAYEKVQIPGAALERPKGGADTRV